MRRIVELPLFLCGNLRGSMNKVWLDTRSTRVGLTGRASQSKIVKTRTRDLSVKSSKSYSPPLGLLLCSPYYIFSNTTHYSHSKKNTLRYRRAYVHARDTTGRQRPKRHQAVQAVMVSPVATGMARGGDRRHRGLLIRRWGPWLAVTVSVAVALQLGARAEGSATTRKHAAPVHLVLLLTDDLGA